MVIITSGPNRESAGGVNIYISMQGDAENPTIKQERARGKHKMKSGAIAQKLDITDQATTKSFKNNNETTNDWQEEEELEFIEWDDSSFVD